MATVVAPTWTAEEEALLLDQMERGLAPRDIVVPGRSIHSIRTKRQMLMSQDADTLLATRNSMDAARRANKIGCDAELRALVSYARKHLPRSDLARLVVG